ncbi:hypothetical protein EK904_010164 [Melospiza melodia maxima]|nr:hypothetical protein EK904_010164 [Melospiza melodia maxima]
MFIKIDQNVFSKGSQAHAAVAVFCLTIPVASELKTRITGVFHAYASSVKREGKIPHTVAFKITTLQEIQRSLAVKTDPVCPWKHLVTGFQFLGQGALPALPLKASGLCPCSSPCCAFFISQTHCFPIYCRSAFACEEAQAAFGKKGRRLSSSSSTLIAYENNNSMILRRRQQSCLHIRHHMVIEIVSSSGISSSMILVGLLPKLAMVGSFMNLLNKTYFLQSFSAGESLHFNSLVWQSQNRKSTVENKFMYNGGDYKVLEKRTNILNVMLFFFLSVPIYENLGNSSVFRKMGKDSVSSLSRIPHQLHASHSTCCSRLQQAHCYPEGIPLPEQLELIASSFEEKKKKRNIPRAGNFVFKCQEYPSRKNKIAKPQTKNPPKEINRNSMRISTNARLRSSKEHLSKQKSFTPHKFKPQNKKKSYKSEIRLLLIEGTIAINTWGKLCPDFKIMDVKDLLHFCWTPHIAYQSFKGKLKTISVSYFFEGNMWPVSSKQNFDLGNAEQIQIHAKSIPDGAQRTARKNKEKPSFVLDSQGKHAKPSSSLLTDLTTEKYHLTAETQTNYLKFFKTKVYYQSIVKEEHFFANSWNNNGFFVLGQIPQRELNCKIFWIKPSTAKAFHELIAGMFLDALRLSCLILSYCLHAAFCIFTLTGKDYLDLLLEIFPELP